LSGARARIAAELHRVGDCEHPGIDALGCRESCHDVAVAGVIAGAADHLPAPRLGKPLPRGTHGRLGRPRHQRVARNLTIGNDGTIDLAHGRNGVDISRQGFHRGDYTGARHGIRIADQARKN
jgi:hypothetical protein